MAEFIAARPNRFTPLRSWFALVAVLLSVAVIAAPAVVASPAVAAPSSSSSPDSAPSGSAPSGSAPSGSAPSGSAPSGSAPSNSGATQDSGASEPSSYARLDVESVTPTMVTSGSGPAVTVTGTIHNVADRALSSLTMRLERGPRVADAAGLRTGLLEGAPVVAGGDFVTVSRSLGPDARQRFTLRMNVSGPGGLGIDATGVYPLNVVLDGLTPSGVSVRMAQARTLLPVLSLPPDPTRAQQYIDPTTGVDDGDPTLGPDGSTSANTSSPARLTMLWPLAAPPQLAPGVLGGGTEPVRLISDDMARSLSPGGRLYTLVDSLHRVVGPTDPTAAPPDDSDGPDASGQDSAGAAPSGPGSSSGGSSAGGSSAGGSSVQGSASAAPGAAGPSRLQQSMCLAVDPDLLVTARAMSRGYVVSENPADPMSPTVPGTGRQAATNWLTTLRQIASRLCVVALPFAQADLTALHRVDNVGLTSVALRSPADIVDAILGVTSVRGLVIPALGGIDRAGAQLLTSSRTPRVLTAASTIAPDAATADFGDYLVDGVHAQTFEMPITGGLAGMGTVPGTPTLTPPDQQVDVAGESPGSRRQAGLAALAYPSINAPTLGATGGSAPGESVPGGSPTGRSSVVMPPTYWSATDADADALFSTATILLGSGVAVPGPLSELPAQLDRAQTPAALIDPPGVGSIAAASSQPSSRAVTSIRSSTETSFRLQSSLVDAADVDASPERYVAPLREDLLRGIRSPNQQSDALRADLRARRATTLRAVTSTLTRMQQSVAILDPGGRYTLASERSPLLLVIRNSLALPIRVRLETTAPADLQIGDVGTIEIPANGTRQLQLPTRAGSSEALTVTITLSTSTGLSLGSPIRLSVHSNAYGKPLFWVTICAGAALVLLTARRLWHRFRGQPDPADADRPEPDEHEKLLAGSTYQHRRRTLQHEGVHDGGSAPPIDVDDGPRVRRSPGESPDTDQQAPAPSRPARSTDRA